MRSHLCSASKAIWECVCVSVFCFIRFFPAFVVLFSFIAFLCIFVFHPSSCYRINIQLTIALYVRESVVYCFVFILLLLFTTILINVFLMENCIEKKTQTRIGRWEIFLHINPLFGSWVEFALLRFVVARQKKTIRFITHSSPYRPPLSLLPIALSSWVA